MLHVVAELSSFQMMVRTIVFLFLLSLGGYIFINFFRNGSLFVRKENTGDDCDVTVKAVKIIGHKKSVILLECAEKRILLGVADNTITKLSEWPRNSTIGGVDIGEHHEVD